MPRHVPEASPSPGARRRLQTVVFIASAVLLAACAVDQSPTSPSVDREVTFSPPRGVRGADLRVTVEGLDDHSGAQVDLTVRTKEGTDTLGVGSAEDRVDDKGRLETTITVPGVLGHEYQVVPGEYRMIFVVRTPEFGPRRLRFEETLEVIPAAVGEKYAHSPNYECLEYTYFDGRLWERESGDLTTPVAGSTIELMASDRAVYMTQEGKTVVFRLADTAAFDPETYRCPPISDDGNPVPNVRGADVRVTYEQSEFEPAPVVQPSTPLDLIMDDCRGFVFFDVPDSNVDQENGVIVLYWLEGSDRSRTLTILAHTKSCRAHQRVAEFLERGY